MIIQKRIPISGLLRRFEDCLRDNEYCISYRYTMLRYASDILRTHLLKNLEYIDQGLIDAALLEHERRMAGGELSKGQYDKWKRCIERFLIFVETGKIGMLPNPMRGSRQKIQRIYEELSDLFLQSLTMTENAQHDCRWVTRMYLGWLESEGVLNVEEINIGLVQRFLLKCSQQYSQNTMKDILIYLRTFHKYLYENKIVKFDFTDLLSFKVSHEEKVQSVPSAADIEKMLSSIDRSTIVGRRNYAVMMLGTVLGLRACDVVKMRLSDIDWQHGEIHIRQDKTDLPVVLPLTQDVGEALKDYILHARPATIYDELFVRIHAPHTPIKAAVTIGEVYEKCCIDAGLPPTKRFHNLRRARGTSMVANGVSVTDVAQVFGDILVESTRPYLSADMEHMKMCALSFCGIELKKG